jgi:nucleotide-binding universal stress UspA family protein
MFNKILVCVDGSERSLDAARVAAHMATVHHAALTLLHVFQKPTIKEPFPGAPTFALPLLEQYERDMKQAVLERTTRAIHEIGNGYEVLEEVGEPAEVIARVADSRDYDLIVMGSRNLDKDRVTQLGSVSHGVLCRAHCPTLIVR